jgi:hypothetical protein
MKAFTVTILISILARVSAETTDLKQNLRDRVQGRELDTSSSSSGSSGIGGSPGSSRGLSSHKGVKFSKSSKSKSSKSKNSKSKYSKSKNSKSKNSKSKSKSR